jgi:hypothetical protein
VEISQGTDIGKNHWQQAKAVRKTEEDDAEPTSKENLKYVTLARRQG